MNQRIKLTYTSKDGNKIFVEECDLVDENGDIFTIDGVFIENGMEIFMNGGRVLFEDEVGIFGLDPERVVKIEIL